MNNGGWISRALAHLAMLGFALIVADAWAQTYSRAGKIGKVKGLEDLGCKGGFVDIKGKCWECPSGYRHDDVFRGPTDPKVCKDEGGRSRKEGTKHGKARIAVPPCPANQWLSTHDGFCYSCPGGYNHDVTKFGNVDGVCWKDNPDRYSAAKAMAGNAFCENKSAFPDPIDGGTCWTCPPLAPTRNLGMRVDSDKACVSAKCGMDGGRPCLVTERFPSCDAGLVEDIVRNACVTDAVAFATCKATVSALKSGRIPPQLQPAFNQAQQRTRVITPVQLDEYKKRALGFVQAHQGAIPEIQRMYQLIQSQKGMIDELFDESVLCSPSKLKAMVTGRAKALVTPNYRGNVFFGNTLVASAAAELGVQTGLILVIGFTLDRNGLPTFSGEMGVYGWVGPQYVTNVTAGLSRGYMIFPAAKLKDFEGWGWGLGMNVGVPTLKVVSGGVDVSFGTTLLPNGFGANMGVGAGVLPADGGISVTHSWALWSTQDWRADVVKVLTGN